MPTPRPLPTAQLDSASAPYLRELGRLVIAASRLEELGRGIASLTTSVDDATPIDEVLEDLAKRIPRRKPPLERTLSDDLVAWIAGARMLLDARSRVFAVAAYGHFTGSSSDAVQVVMPDESIVAADTEYLERMNQRIHRHDISGQLLHLQLEPPVVGSGSDPIVLRPDSATASSTKPHDSLEANG